MYKFSYTMYFDALDRMLRRVREMQGKNILEAAQLVSNCIANDGLIQVFGTGHSHMLAREISFRAGTLAPINLIYDPSLAGSLQMEKSSYLERLAGYAKILIDYIDPTPEDIFIIISNSGRNAVPVEMALEARERGNKVIAVTSVAYSKSSTSRHSSGKRLFEIADVVLDNCGGIGDIAVKVPELDQGLGPTSTITGAYLLNAVMVQAAFNLLDQSIEPPVLWSGNLDKGMAHNEGIFRKYRKRIRSW
jgi:uncharacterized phosphosugar-binding protein